MTFAVARISLSRVEQQNDYWVINLKECTRKRSWSHLSWTPEMLSLPLISTKHTETMKNLSRSEPRPRFESRISQRRHRRANHFRANSSIAQTMTLITPMIVMLAVAVVTVVVAVVIVAIWRKRLRWWWLWWWWWWRRRRRWWRRRWWRRRWWLVIWRKRLWRWWWGKDDDWW